MKQVFYLFLYLASLVGYSQDCHFEVSGQVYDYETKEPIPFVTVLSSESGKGAVTDLEGNFLIKNLCNPETELNIIHLGYKKAVHHHDVYHEEPIIYLAPDNQLLESVVVEGKYNPSSFQTIAVDEIDHTQIAESQSSNLGELAQNVTGVSMISTGQNVVKPVIHGLHSNRVLIVNNGVRHEFQNWGVEHAPEIDPTAVDNLQVLKGAATVRYGPDALGGVILISPKKLDLSSHLHGEVSLNGASNGRAGGSQIEMNKGWEHIAIGASGNLTRQGDLHAPSYQLTNTAKEEYSYSLSSRYHRGNFDLEGYYSHFYQNLGILRGSVNGNLSDLIVAMNNEPPKLTSSFSYDINNPRQEVTHDLAKVKGQWVMGDQDLSFQYSYQSNHRYEYDVRRGSLNELPSIDLVLSSQNLDMDWNHKPVGELSGLLGAQLAYQDNNNNAGTNTVPYVPNYNNYRIGFFAIESLEQQWGTLELGIRYDYQATSIRGRAQDNSIFRDNLKYSQFTGSLGYTKLLKDHLNFQSNVGLAWRPPNVGELYSFGKHGFSIEYGIWRYQVIDDQVTVNSVLSQDEKPVSPEMGLKWINSFNKSSKSESWEIAAYLNYIQHFFYSKPYGVTNTVRGAFPYFVYDQTDAVFAGIDASYEKTLVKQLKLQWQGSYVYAKDVRNQDDFVEIPPLNTNLTLRYSIPETVFGKNEVFVKNNYSFQYWQQPRTITAQEFLDGQVDVASGNFDFMDAPESFLLTDIGWSASLKKVEWMVRINNLFDVSYRTNTDRLRYFADQMGRNIKISVTYQIQ